MSQRVTPLERDPEPGKVWRYSPADAERLAAEVMAATSNGSFVSTMIRVLSRGGASKTFREITGQDGLTVGIGDFAGGGIAGFFERAASDFPDDFAAAFPDEGLRAQLLNARWVDAQNGGNSRYDNNGLIRYRWVREGLARILDDVRHDGWQLAQVVRGKVRPSVETAAAQGIRTAFGVAALCGIANSYGAGGMRRTFAAPAAARYAGDEAAQIAWMLERYVAGEVDTDRATRPLVAELERALRGETPQLPDRGLGHRGRRVRELLMRFPSVTAPFMGLGTFTLTAEQVWAGDPTTAG